jgi:hypothetical protein
MKKLLFLLVLGIVFSTSCEIDESPTSVKNEYGDIVGYIHNYSNSQTISNAIVTLSPTEGSTISGFNGSFRLSDIREGKYSITVNKKGYQEYEGSVVVRPNKTTYLDMFLKEVVEEAP